MQHFSDGVPSDSEKHIPVNVKLWETSGTAGLYPGSIKGLGMTHDKVVDPNASFTYPQKVGLFHITKAKAERSGVFMSCPS